MNPFHSLTPQEVASGGLMSEVDDSLFGLQCGALVVS